MLADIQRRPEETFHDPHFYRHHHRFLAGIAHADSMKTDTMKMHSDTMKTETMKKDGMMKSCNTMK
ncbi:MULTISPECIES: hypothetical protein [Rhizobium]|jgi:hypothetical protein|uniref:hypothetical protein n=1 Tax=Rhizobium TaxID=379 RepID=UPI001F24DB70